jgi:hypothetical protein
MASKIMFNPLMREYHAKAVGLLRRMLMMKNKEGKTRMKKDKNEEEQEDDREIRIWIY